MTLACLVALLLVRDACAVPAPDVRIPLAPRWRILFLRVDFKDTPSQRPATDFRNPARSGLIDRLASYYDEASLGRFQIDPIVSDRVYHLPGKARWYWQKPGQLVNQALHLASQPGADGERALLEEAKADAVVVFFAGPGAESDIENKRHREIPWSNAIVGGPFGGPGAVSVPRAMVVSEDPIPPLEPFGVLAHELGHLLGLPELYAPSKPHEGIGIWGLMGQGTWVAYGDRPPQPCAWSKLKLGWADPIVIDSSQTVKLPAVEKSGKVALIYARGAAHPSEYFLIENRMRTGADRSLPGEGLLIWHVDERLTAYRNSQDDPKHKRLDLLTADSWPSHLDIGHARGGNRGDAGDPWADRAQGPGPSTQPSTASYDGAPGRFSIENISPAGEVMTFDVVFARDRDAGASDAEKSTAPTAQPSTASGDGRPQP